MKLLITEAALREMGGVPSGVELMVFDPAVPPRGFDAAFLSRELYFGGARDAPPPAWLTFVDALLAEQGLKWLQVHSAGVDRAQYRQLMARGVRLTTAAGANSMAVAQSAASMVVAMGRGLPRWIAAQARHEWQPIKPPLPADLQGRQCVILGLGPVGMETGRILGAVGLRCIGLSRRARTAPPPGFAATGTYGELAALLPGTHWLVLACPLSDETRGMIGAAQLAAMPRGAGVSNVARGGVMDEDAALAALRSGQLGCAYMDVFALEPLPADSPWWDAPNAIISPHAAGPAAGNLARAAGIFRRNLDLFLAGKPLINEAGT